MPQRAELFELKLSLMHIKGTLMHIYDENDYSSFKNHRHAK